MDRVSHTQKTGHSRNDFIGAIQSRLPNSDILFDMASAASTGLANANEDLAAAQAAAAEKGAEAAGIIKDAFAPVGDKMAELATITEGAAIAATNLGNAAGDGADGAGGKAAKGASKAAKATRDLLSELHRELDARKALIGLHGEELQRVEALQQVQGKLGDEIGHYSQSAVQAAADRIVAIENEEKAWEAATQRMEGLVDGVAGAWGDWLSGGLKDFKGFISNVLGSFQNMISEMIAEAARAPISRALGGLMGIFDPLAGALRGAGLPAIPALATGGTAIRAGLAQINESGGELVSLSRGATVVPHDLSRMVMQRQEVAAQPVHVTVGVDRRSGNLTAFVDDRADQRVQRSDQQFPSRWAAVQREKSQRYD